MTLNVTMLEQTEVKVTGHRNDALVETICDIFWDCLQKHQASNADEVSLTHLLHGIQTDWEQGEITEFNTLLN